MTINGIIENQIVNHNNVNGKTNKEMYRTANRVCYDTFWFSERGLATKGNPFIKANNYTVAYLDNAESGEIDHWIKIDNAWYYATKEQLTNLFYPNYEGTDEEIDNYVEDNVTIEEENDCIDKYEYKLSDAEKEILDYVENGENDSEIELIQPALNVKIRVFKHYDGVCGIIVDSMIPAVDTFKLNDVDIDDVRYFVTDHDGIVDFDWLNNAIGITVEANERFLAK